MSDRPYKVDSGPDGAREGDIPYYVRWSDGSEYRITQSVEDERGRRAIRMFHGPMFGRAHGDWSYEVLWWA